MGRGWNDVITTRRDFLVGGAWYQTERQWTRETRSRWISEWRGGELVEINRFPRVKRLPDGKALLNFCPGRMKERLSQRAGVKRQHATKVPDLRTLGVLETESRRSKFFYGVEEGAGIKGRVVVWRMKIRCDRQTKGGREEEKQKIIERICGCLMN